MARSRFARFESCGHRAVRGSRPVTLLCHRWRQIRDPQEVVGSADQMRRLLRSFDPVKSGFSKAAVGLHPAEDLLDALPDPLTDAVARVPGSSYVDGGVLRLRRDVRRDAELATRIDKRALVVPLVASDRLSSRVASSGSRRTSRRKRNTPPSTREPHATRATELVSESVSASRRSSAG